MLTGGCQCGAVRYEIDGALPDTIFVCHCRECQKQSASAFGVGVQVSRAAFRLVQGTLTEWQRVADSGNRVNCAFCPECGTRVWHSPANNQDVMRVRGGTLDDPPDLARAVHIWTKRKLAGVIIPDDAQQFPEQPE